MRRFSIRKLMGFVLAIAVAFAALRGANDHWAGGLVLGFLGLLGYAILASIHRQGIARAAWLGFLVAAGGYFLAVRALPEQERGWLPTSQLLAYVEQQVVGVNTYTVNFTTAAREYHSDWRTVYPWCHLDGNHGADDYHDARHPGGLESGDGGREQYPRR